MFVDQLPLIALPMDLLVVSVTFVNPGVPLCRRVYLHLALDTMLPAPILANLKIKMTLTIENIVLAWSRQEYVLQDG